MFILSAAYVYTTLIKIPSDVERKKLFDLPDPVFFEREKLQRFRL